MSAEEKTIITLACNVKGCANIETFALGQDKRWSFSDWWIVHSVQDTTREPRHICPDHARKLFFQG